VQKLKLKLFLNGQCPAGQELILLSPLLRAAQHNGMTSRQALRPPTKSAGSIPAPAIVLRAAADTAG
jgi:hypothetical protein